MSLTSTTTKTQTITTTPSQNHSLDLLPSDYHSTTPFTSASLNYWKDSDPIPDHVKSTLSDHELRVTRRSEKSPNVDPHMVKINNIRGIEDQYSLSVQGFQITELDSKMTKEDWCLEEKRKEIYFAEVSEVLKRVTGAKFVHSYEHMVRRKSLTEALTIPSDGLVDIDGPVRRVHIDESPPSARREFKYYVNPERASNPEQAEKFRQYSAKGQHFGIYNIWKPLKTIRRDPLCFCDPRSLRVEDLRSGRVTVPNVGEIENFAILPPKEENRHEWHFLKGQREDEALVFKIYDSRDSRGEQYENEAAGWGLNQFGVAHTSFVDPGTEGFVETRESCEVRSFCVF